LTFSVTIENKKVKTVIDLIPNGRNLFVDQKNKKLYSQLLTQYLMFE